MIPYSDAGCAHYVRVFGKILRKNAGMCAPVRKRRKRVQKKIDKRGGALHYGVIHLSLGYYANIAE